MKKLFLIFLLTLTYTINLTTNAEVRFVNKTGSSTPPYTSWATAADSIQKCINISQSGDTIYVANGTYKEYVRMTPNISLIGSGIDSCVIDTRGLTLPQFRAVIIKDSCLVEGFQIVVHYNTENFAGIYGNGVGKETVIRNNLIKDCTIGISFIQTSALVQDNIIRNTRDGIQIFPVFSDEYPIVERNYISDSEFGISVEWPLKPTITNNTIYFQEGFSGIKVFAPESSFCANNIVIVEQAVDGISYEDTNGPFFNNAVIGNCSFQAMRFWKPNEIYNNIVADGDRGIEVVDNEGVVIQYNNVWNMNTPYINYSPDSTNLSENPMFVDKNNYDFHLQMFSPLIDAGNPTILDKDGSRSDLGIYGGPLGDIYHYLDLPPAIPESFITNIFGDTAISVSWELNTEADFKYYNIYRDSISGFIPDSITFLSSIDTSYFEDVIKGIGKNIYYKITSVDSQFNESIAGEEIAVILTGIDSPTINTIAHYNLFQNYPNPFNPETIIGYRLKEPGYVKLTVYDIKGELIEKLVNEYKDKGYHEVKFTAYGSEGWKNKLIGLASGIYLYKLDVIDSRHIPVYSQINKMILVK
ncbi:MAG: hypothetical protein HND52_11365 [Ignavibacteriae bacterium]|nr:hypothetical protein [Ignavibacteriota bacterium]NOG98547.1 hypothetical protein [Ignavibacteriota bacterium]